MLSGSGVSAQCAFFLLKTRYFTHEVNIHTIFRKFAHIIHTIFRQKSVPSKLRKSPEEKNIQQKIPIEFIPLSEYYLC